MSSNGSVTSSPPRVMASDSDWTVPKDGAAAPDVHVNLALDNAAEPTGAPKGFWVIMLALCVCLFVAVLENNSVATALPTIVNDLHGTDFIWVGSAFTITNTAFVPVTGGLSQVFGRKPIILLSVLVFAAGSAICGAATNMNMLIAGRAVQGAGAGGMCSLPMLVLSDVVPLRDRGAYIGLFAVSWCFSAGIGPVIGGALAQHGQWRWLFYLNLPLCGVVGILLMVFLALKYPRGSFISKLLIVDWIGSALVVGATVSLAIALTWAGIQFSWSSAHVLVPLILGFLGYIAFFIYEERFASKPIVPWEIISNRTSVSGYIQTFTYSVGLFILAYDLPIYFQACKGASPTGSGIDLFTTAFVTPVFTIVGGVSIKASKAYRPQLFIAFVLMVLGLGLMTLLSAGRDKAFVIGIQAIFAVGCGIAYAGTVFPVLAPLPVQHHPTGNAFLIFSRQLGQVWGVTIGGAILQNQLQHRLPAGFFAQFPAGTQVAYAAIPTISSLEPQLRDTVRVAFADSLKVAWAVAAAIVALGLVSCLMMKAMRLHTETDAQWGMEEKEMQVRSPQIQDKNAAVSDA